MTSEPPKTYFFDDDDLNTPFDFVAPTKFHTKILKTAPLLKATFLRSSHSSAPKPGFYTLHRKLLAYYKNEGDPAPQSVLRLSECRLKVISGAQEGFGFSKNNGNHEFFSSDKKVVEAWVTSLRTMCVMTNFHEEYKALKMIGRGSFAKVYLVEAKDSGKTYAVKAFTKEAVIASNKTSAKPAMINEIDIMRMLDHDNIIKLYEVYETEKSIYLVLDLIQGKSLQDTLKKPIAKDEYSDVRIFNIIRSILDALAYLASKGIMHRDLKPDNILLENDEKVKIVDFGLATYVDVPNYIFKKCGTPGYIAPEVFKYEQSDSSTNYDDRSDVFSAGAIFYYLLYGKPFFEGANGSEILKSNRQFAADTNLFNPIKKSLNSPEGGLSKDAIDLLLKLLEFNKTKRISAMEALSHPYFTPFPTGMCRIGGSNEFKCEALSKYNQDGYYSPTKSPQHSPTMSPPSVFYDKLKTDNLVLSPQLKPARADRFAERGSLYLDMGRPDMNGKLDTLTFGSTGSSNNSMWLNQNQQTQQTSSNNSPSTFARSSFIMEQRMKAGNKSFRGITSMSGNQSVLKAAIFRNMAKNNEQPTEEHKEEVLSAPTNLSRDRRFSAVVNIRREDLLLKLRNTSDEEKEKTSVTAENSPTNSSPDVSPNSKAPTSPMRRFQPFAQK